MKENFNQRIYVELTFSDQEKSIYGKKYSKISSSSVVQEILSIKVVNDKEWIYILNYKKYKNRSNIN